MAGFTTVRNLGDEGNSSIALRNAIDGGFVAGPRIFSAGKAIATTGGHADPTNGRNWDGIGDPGPGGGSGVTKKGGPGPGGGKPSFMDIFSQRLSEHQKKAQARTAQPRTPGPARTGGGSGSALKKPGDR